MVACIALWASMCGCNRPAEAPASQAVTDTVATPSVQDPFQEAKALQQRGDIEGALEAYDRFLARNPRDLGALGNRAQLLQSKGNWQAALEDFNTFLFIGHLVNNTQG